MFDNQIVIPPKPILISMTEINCPTSSSAQSLSGLHGWMFRLKKTKILKKAEKIYFEYQDKIIYSEAKEKQIKVLLEDIDYVEKMEKLKKLHKKFSQWIADETEDNERQFTNYKKRSENNNIIVESEWDIGRRHEFAAEIAKPAGDAWNSLIERKLSKKRKQPILNLISKNLSILKEKVEVLKKCKKEIKQCQSNKELIELDNRLKAFQADLKSNKNSTVLEAIKKIATYQMQLRQVLDIIDTRSKEYCKKAANFLWYGAAGIKAPVIEADGWSHFRAGFFNFFTPSTKHFFVRPVLLRKLSIDDRLFKQLFVSKKDSIEEIIQSFEDKYGENYYLLQIKNGHLCSIKFSTQLPDIVESNTYLCLIQPNSQKLELYYYKNYIEKVKIELNNVKALLAYLKKLEDTNTSLDTLTDEQKFRLKNIIFDHYKENQKLTDIENNKIKKYMQEKKNLERYRSIIDKEKRNVIDNKDLTIRAEKLLELAAEKTYRSLKK